MKASYYIRLDTFHVAIADLTESTPYRTLSGHEIRPAKRFTIINRINVPEAFRGQGHGSTLLKQILADADREKVTLLLEPVATGRNGLAQRDLIKWYKRYGFKTYDAFYLVRPPA